MGTKRDTARHEFDNYSAAHDKARHMGRYSGAAWIAWTRKDGAKHFAQIETADSIKAALLEIGTGGLAAGLDAFNCFCQYAPCSRNSFVVRWRIGIVMFKNHKRGHVTAFSYHR